MAKHIATVSTVVVRDGKRVHVGPGTKHNKGFDFTKDEIEQINRIHPGAIRKPVNESAEDEADHNAKTDTETTPGKEGDKTANKANGKKGGAKAKAAEKDSQSKEATTDTKSEDGEATGQDAEDGEDDDI